MMMSDVFGFFFSNTGEEYTNKNTQKNQHVFFIYFSFEDIMNCHEMQPEISTIIIVATNTHNNP